MASEREWLQKMAARYLPAAELRAESSLLTDFLEAFSGKQCYLFDFSDVIVLTAFLHQNSAFGVFAGGL